MDNKVTSYIKKFALICLILSLSLGILPTNPAIAESNMVLKDFSVDIWPEYDDPRVLVIYQGTFVNEGSSDFSGYVKFNIPQNAQISMACELENGNHLCQPYKTEDKGEFVELRWKSTKIIKPGQEYPVFLEFYYDPIEGGPNKSFDYIFKPSYVINNINMNVKQPLRSEEFTLEPKAVLAQTDSKGFTKYKYNYSDLTPENPVEIKISYIKKDNDPSIQKEVPQASQGAVSTSANDQLPQTEAWKNPIILVTIILFSLVLGGFIFYALSINKNKEQVKVKKSKKNKGASPELLKEKKKLRQMLIKGQISETTYQELVADLEDEYL